MALDTLAQCKACLHLVFCCILLQRQRKSDFQLSMHRLKNQQSKLFQQLHNFKTRQRTLLTGTPLQNNLSELWMLLHFLDASKFQSLQDFEADFSDLSHGDQVCLTYKTAAHHRCFAAAWCAPVCVVMFQQQQLCKDIAITSERNIQSLLVAIR